MSDTIQFVSLSLILCVKKHHIVNTLSKNKLTNLKNDVPESCPVQFSVVVKNSRSKFIPENLHFLSCIGPLVKSHLIALQAVLPGSTIRLAMASASMTGTPRSRNMLETVLLPVATPPCNILVTEGF